MRFVGNEQRTGDEGRRTDDNGRRPDDGDSESPLERVEPASIAVEDVSLSFGDLSVLESVSLTVDPGEFVGFVGPNGAGKTTLLRAISGALEPDSGRVSVDGVDIHDATSKRSSRLVSVVPQDTTLSFSFPVRDVVEMGRHPHRSRFSSPTAADREAVERALERTRTADLADRPIDEVSGGQRQRVVLARAIAQATPVMLLDEPTASLDVNHQVETLELVRELVAEGRTVCAAIHDLDLAARYCDRLVMLADGEVYRNGPPADVLTGAALSDVFDATAAVTRNPITGTETVTALPSGAGNGPESGDGEADGSRETGATDGSAVRIHVVGTGPIASAVLARLEAAPPEFELSVGPVTDGDTAAETARSLEIDRLAVPPFESLSPTDLTAFEDRVRQADVTVVAESVFAWSGSGTGTLRESIGEIATAIAVVTRSGTKPGSELGQRSGSGSKSRDGIAESRANDAALRDRQVLEATPETVLAVVGSALEDASRPADAGSQSESSDGGSSDGGSSDGRSSDGDSSAGVSAGSSSD